MKNEAKRVLSAAFRETKKRIEDTRTKQERANRMVACAGDTGSIAWDECYCCIGASFVH